MTYGATKHDLGNPFSLTAPLTKPPTPWQAPSDKEQEVEKRICPPGWFLTAFLCPFDCAGLLIWYVTFAAIIKAQPGFIVSLVFASVWGCFLTGFAKVMDPGEVWASYASLSEQLETMMDMTILGLLDELRNTAPQISFTGEASHTTGFGDDKDTFTTFSETWYMKYARWRDVSDQIHGLEEFQ